LRIQPLGARVVINTIYDPATATTRSDGGSSVCRGWQRSSYDAGLNAVNRGIAKLARERGFVLADLERLFRGHGITSNEPWFVQVIEPNLAGASGIAEHWHELLTSQ